MSDVNILGCNVNIAASIINKATLGDCLQADLSAVLPSQVGELVELTELTLNTGVLKGSLPSQLGRLTKLQVLKLNDNLLSSTLPTEIFNLAALQTLELGGNDLSGTIPTELGHLINVVRFNLNHNDLRGRIPTEVGLLTSVVQFSLSLNKVTDKLPTQIGALQALTTLQLVENDLTGSIPTQIGKLRNLRSMTLPRNKMYGPIPTELGNLRVLNFVDFSSNQLTHLPSQVGKLDKTRYFLLQRNNVQGGLPDELFNMTGLVWADISGNDFSSRLPRQIGRLTAVSELRFMDNKLRGPIPTEIGELLQLSNGFLHENRLEGEIPTQIGRLPRLAQLDISSNVFTSSLPTELGEVQTLMRFFAEKSNISGTVPAQLGDLSLLRSVRLRENRLSGEIPASLGNLNLRLELSLDDNRLTGTIPSEIGRLTNLRGLTLSDNELHGKLPSSLSNLKVLGTFVLARNNLDILCDCDLLSWFSDLVDSATITDASSLPTCSQDNEYFGLYAHVLRSEKEAPCTAPTIDEDASLSEAASVDLAWTFDTSRISKEVAYSVDALDEASAQAFSACESFIVDSERFGSGFSAFAFQIDIRESNQTRVHCIWARKAVASFPIGQNFRFRLEGFSPATDYEFSVRALFLFFGRDKSSVRVVVGPRSGRRLIQTNEYTPLAGPMNIRTIRRAEDEIELSWSEPPSHLSNAFGSAEITRIEALAPSSLEPVLTFQTKLRSHTIRSLQEQTMYKFRIRVKNTHGGYSPFTETTVATCPKDMKTAEGVPEECVAVAGHFALTNETALSCEALPNWALNDSLCLVAGLTVENLLVKPGVWRASLTSPNFLRCPHQELCDGSAKHVTAAVGPDQYCAANHQGIYCMDCVPNFTRRGTTCIVCDNSSNSSMILQATLGVFTGILLVTLLILIVFQKAMLRTRRDLKGGKTMVSSEDRDRFSFIGKAVRVKLRILFGFLQLLFAYQSMLVGETSQMQVFLRMFRFSSNLQFIDFSWAFNLSCLWQLESHSIRLYSQTLLPIALVMLLLMLGKLSKRIMPVLGDTAWNSFVSAVLFILFVIYPETSLTIFETFWCETFKEADGKQVLRSALAADYSTSCEPSAERLRSLIFAGVMVVVYPLGVVLIYLRELYRYWKTASPEQSNAAARRVSFLLYPYTPKQSWFEAYELIRKLMQVSVIGFLRYNLVASSSAFISPERPAKLAIATVGTNLTIAAIVFLVYIQPYKHSGDFAYAVFSLFILALVTQVFGGAFDGVLVGDHAAASVGSIEEQHRQVVGVFVLVETVLLFVMATAECIWERLERHSTANP